MTMLPQTTNDIIITGLFSLKELWLIWLAVSSVILFCLMYIDKAKAIKGKWRISEKTLLLLSALGGFLGGIVGMYLFRHKTKKWYFHAVFILSAIAHLSIIFILYFK